MNKFLPSASRSFLISSLVALAGASQGFAAAPARPDPSAPSAPVAIKEVSSPFEGRFFVPDDGKTHPGILYLHGSEGGIDLLLEGMAKSFAERGYATLALCWFGCGEGSSRPAKIDEVDLSYTYDAWKWLKSSSHVKGQRAALYGISRGAEHSLLLQTYLSARMPALPRPDAVVLHAPFNQILPPFSGNFSEGFAYRWKNSHEGLASYTAIDVTQARAPLFVSHGLIDKLSNPEQTNQLQDALQAAEIPFTRETRLVEGSECKEPPIAARPDVGGLAEVEFHLYQCEKHIFSKAASPVRDAAIASFLKKAL